MADNHSIKPSKHRYRLVKQKGDFTPSADRNGDINSLTCSYEEVGSPGCYGHKQQAFRNNWRHGMS